MLVALAKAEGGVVTRDELIRLAWDGAHTTDEAVAAVIYELRKALGDDARSPRYLETIRGSGYRLLVPVEWLPGGMPPEGTASPPEPEESPGPGSPTAAPAEVRAVDPPRRGHRRGGLLLGAGILVLTAAATFFLGSSTSQGTGDAGGEIRSLAVLPVSAFGPPASELGMAAALTDMLIADLDRVCPVDVAPGLAVRGGPDEGASGRWRLDELSGELGVDAVVETFVLRSGDRLWISAQLVETGTGRLLWSGSYDREGPDDLALLREIALDVADEVSRLLEEPPDAGSP